MRIALLTATLGALVTLLLPASAADFRISDYLGGWTNSDPNTRSITWISVRQEGGKIFVQVWGKCQPTDCDWGTAPATAFGRSIRSSADAPIASITAVFSKRFADTRLSLRLTTRDELTAVTQTQFTDFSGRADYEVDDRLVRAKTSLPSTN